MRTPHTRLQSTYVMLPSSSRLDSSIDYHTFRSSRNTSMHSIDGPLPPVNVDDSDVPQKGVFRDFLGNSACFMQLFDSGPGPDDAEGNSTGPSIATKTHVSLIDDFPVYNLSSYRQKLQERSAFRASRAFSLSLSQLSLCTGLTSLLSRAAKIMLLRWLRRAALRPLVRPGRPLRDVDRV